MTNKLKNPDIFIPDIEPSDADLHESPETVQQYVISLEEEVEALRLLHESGSFWRGIFSDNRLTDNEKKILVQLSEYRSLIKTVEEVFPVITGGQVIHSDINAATILEAFEDYVASLVDYEIEVKIEDGKLFRMKA